jgi:acyl-CoA synthetase (AMP-forming)/AMP-acid ligase II
MLADRVGGGNREEAFTADGYLRTGDLGDLKDGVLTVGGRADGTIVTGGKNVAPAEVEAVLEQHRAIRRAVVFGIPDETWGELVAAVLEPEESADVRGAVEVLRAWLALRLPSHQRPRRVAWLPQLPATPTGKVDRSAAAAIGKERATDL